MSPIDLAILGIVIEKPVSAYDIQKDVQYHHMSRWTGISVTAVYKNVHKLWKRGFLNVSWQDTMHGRKKAVYSISESGRKQFSHMMHELAQQPVPVQFDLNVVVANLGRLDAEEAHTVIMQMKKSITDSRAQTEELRAQYAEIPVYGRTIFDQQLAVYDTLLDWLESFSKEVET